MARVLIIEDNLDAAQTLSYLLRHAGHAVEYAINGYAALEMAARMLPDVILLDIGLPDFDGCELARRLRRRPGLEAVRIIAMTGRESDDEQRARAAGCESFFRKPFSVEVLDALISRSPHAVARAMPGDPKRLN
jgi:CheY-like chemotaxis protein